MQKFTRRDLAGLALCVVLASIFLTIGIRYFDAAFPEASVDFKVGRDESERLARSLALAHGAKIDGYVHSSQFTSDDSAKIFLERKLGLKAANVIMRRDVKVWRWRHRWFRWLQREEYAVEIAPTGELVAWEHVVADEAAAPNTPPDLARARADEFLRRNGIAPQSLRFLGASERQLPKRRETILTYESTSVHPAGASYRYTLVARGGAIASFRQALRVPDEWTREYEELRSKNTAAGIIDEVFIGITMVAALVVFIRRLRWRAIDIRFAVGAGVVAFALVALSTLNSYPAALASYDTNTSHANLISEQVMNALLGGFVSAVVLMVIVGAGEALFRERYPQHLAVPRLFRRDALRSKRVFFGFVIGLTLFSGFLAYQVIFYLVATHFGAWSPAEVPYDDILTTKFPWLAVLFMGFYPAMSEEFLSRGFSIPFIERLVRSRALAIVLAGFIWGFGHAAYPNQPFFIRGVEVGLAGVIIGLLMQRFGILPLLVWHYTVDALYTAFVLMRSGNVYYIVSSGLASLLFVVPLLLSIVLYFRHGGFENDEHLQNSASDIPLPPAVSDVQTETVDVPAPTVTSRFSWALALLLLAAGVGSLWLRKPSLSDAADFRTTRDQAIAAARQHLASQGVTKFPSHVLAAPAGGFRRWIAPPPGAEDNGEEEGGRTAGYDTASAEYILRHAPVDRLLEIERNDVRAGTWAVRFFEPMHKEEFRIEVDPRDAKVLGLHEIVAENTPGAKLEQSAAEAIARQTLARYGLNAQNFVTREALRFEQPARRDWLFHFEAKTPLVAAATLRAHVRIAGDRVTQFTRTVHIPENEIRRATQQTALNMFILALRIAGALGLLAIVVNGTLMALRQQHFPWREALRIALWIAPLCIAAELTTFDTLAYNYPTSVAWNTFLVIATVRWIASIAALLLVVFLAAAIILSTRPEARLLFSSRIDALFARDAIARTFGALGIVLLIGSALTLAAWTFHAHFPVHALEPSDELATPLPFLSAAWSIALLSLLIVAFVAAASVSTIRRAPLLVALFAFLIALDPSATADQLPASALFAVAAAVMVSVALLSISGRNALAMATTAVALVGAVEAATLLRNHRPDLESNGIAVIVATVLLLALLWRRALAAAPAET